MIQVSIVHCPRLTLNAMLFGFWDLVEFFTEARANVEWYCFWSGHGIYSQSNEFSPIANLIMSTYPNPYIPLPFPLPLPVIVIVRCLNVAFCISCSKLAQSPLPLVIEEIVKLYSCVVASAIAKGYIIKKGFRISFWPQNHLNRNPRICNLAFLRKL